MFIAQKSLIKNALSIVFFLIPLLIAAPMAFGWSSSSKLDEKISIKAGYFLELFVNNRGVIDFSFCNEESLADKLTFPSEWGVTDEKCQFDEDKKILNFVINGKFSSADEIYKACSFTEKGINCLFRRFDISKDSSWTLLVWDSTTGNRWEYEKGKLVYFGNPTKDSLKRIQDSKKSGK